MKKIELIELVQDFLAGGDAPSEIRSRYHQKVIEKYVGMAINNIMYDVYRDAKKYHQFDMLDTLTAAYIVPVYYNSIRNEYYSDLPIAIAQLPDQSAIRHISPTKDQSFAFKYQNNTANPMWSVLEAGYIKDLPCYYVEGMTIFYPRFEEYADITTVLMKLIPPFNDWDWDKEIPVVAGKEFTIFEMVSKFLMQKPADDDINDGADEQLR